MTTKQDVLNMITDTTQASTISYDGGISVNAYGGVYVKQSGDSNLLIYIERSTNKLVKTSTYIGFTISTDNPFLFDI